MNRAMNTSVGTTPDARDELHTQRVQSLQLKPKDKQSKPGPKPYTRCGKGYHQRQA